MRLFFLYLSCAVVLIDTDHAIEVSRQLPDLFTEDLFYLIRRKRTVIRNYYIKDQIGMRRSGNHTEIMHFQFRIQLFKKLGYLIPHLIGKVIVGDTGSICMVAVQFRRCFSSRSILSISSWIFRISPLAETSA